MTEQPETATPMVDGHFRDLWDSLKPFYPPVAELPVRFIGGPQHGHTLRDLSPELIGLQTLDIGVPPRSHFRSADGKKPAIRYARYRFDRISDELHMWVYQWVNPAEERRG